MRDTNAIKEQNAKLIRAKAEAFAFAASTIIGKKIFDQKAESKTREKQYIQEVLHKALKEVMKDNPDFDVDLLISELDNKSFIGKLKSSLDGCFKDNGWVQSNIVLDIQEINKNEHLILQRLQKDIEDRYKLLNKIIDPQSKDYSKDAHKKIKKTKEEINDAKDIEEWEKKTTLSKVKLTIEEEQQNGKKKEYVNVDYEIEVAIREEVAEDGEKYQIIYPIITNKILDLFAKDEEWKKSNKSLNEWLKDKVPEWKGKVVVADIRADVSDAFQVGSNLEGINLSGSKITNLNLHNADFRNVDLKDCDIYNLTLDNCLYSGLDLRGADINTPMFDQLNFHQENWSYPSQEYTKDKSTGKPIIVSVASIKDAVDAKVAHSSLEKKVKEEKLEFDPFYVRKGNNNEIALEKRLVIKATTKDVEKYLAEINKLEEIKKFKNHEIEVIDWRKIPTFNDFIAKEKKVDTEDLSVFADLSSVNWKELDLTGANFSRTNLHKAELKEINARGANFFGACLEGANLDGAKLQGAIFNQANMQYISMKKAHLQGSNLSDANLERAQMQGIKGTFVASRANMRYANLDDAEINESVLNKMRAQGISLARAHAEYCQIRGANLVDAKLNEAFLEGADLSGAQMQRIEAVKANFFNAILSDIDAEKGNFERAFMVGVEAKRANLKGANLKSAKADYADFEEAKLDFITAKRAEFKDAVLKEASAIGADFERAILERVDASNINLAFATLDHAKVKKANLTGAVLAYINAQEANFESALMEKVNLKFAKMEKAFLERANLEGADIRGADLSKADINGANLEHIKFDESTNTLGLKNIDKANVGDEFYQHHSNQQWNNYPIKSAGIWVYNKGKNTLSAGYNILKSLITGIIPLSLGGGTGAAIGIVLLFVFFPAAGVPVALLLVGGCATSCGVIAYAATNNEARKEAWLSLKELVGIRRPFTGHEEVAQKEKVGPQEYVPSLREIKEEIDKEKVNEQLKQASKDHKASPMEHSKKEEVKDETSQQPKKHSEKHRPAPAITSDATKERALKPSSQSISR